jgi:hypothetical protein
MPFYGRNYASLLVCEMNLAKVGVGAEPEAEWLIRVYKFGMGDH